MEVFTGDIGIENIRDGNLDFEVEIEDNDEIGELCDVINYMAGELSKAEQLKNDFISSVSAFENMTFPLRSYNVAFPAYAVAT